MVRRFERAGAKTDTAPKQYRTTSRVIKTSNNSPSNQDTDACDKTSSSQQAKVSSNDSSNQDSKKKQDEFSISFFGFARLNVKSEGVPALILYGGAAFLTIGFLGYNLIKGSNLFWKKKELEVLKNPNIQQGNSSEKRVPQAIPDYLQETERKMEKGTLNDLNSGNIEKQKKISGKFLNEGDIGILFSNGTNAGKTVFAIQTAIDAANGEPSSVFPSQEKPDAQFVYYYNFEMSKSQLKERYIGNNDYMLYPSNFVLIDAVDYKLDWQETIKSIATETQKCSSSHITVYIDTLKDLFPQVSGTDVTVFLGKLSTIQKNAMNLDGKHITFVLVSQSVKKKEWEPTGIDDISGSAALSCLVDSILLVGPTCLGEEYRMVKLLKTRAGSKGNSVSIIKFEETPYWHYKYIEERNEWEVLPECPKKKPDDALSKAPITSQVSSSSAEKMVVPDDVLQQMADWYQYGVPGHGYKQVARMFGEPYGIKHSQQIKRLFEERGVKISKDAR